MIGVVGVLLSVITLHGATGDELRARAYFDANNVKVGDPMILTVDFIGTFDAAALHPPALSHAVDRRVWRIDDASAKTQTSEYRTSLRRTSLMRTITYRVRPLREGVIWLPELEFEYSTPEGVKRRARTSAVPVHAIRGEQVVVAELQADERELPSPPPLIGANAEVRAANEELRNDEAWFKWKKACAHPTADAFTEFDFPAARMNEARCAILDGNWARAMKLYSRLEWSVGQTPEIEDGMIAALAVKAQSRAVELPIWRQVGRPVLQFAWAGRLGILVGGLVAVILLFWLLRRIIRALACIAVPFALVCCLDLSPGTCCAQGLFNFNFGGFEELNQIQPAKITVTVDVDRKELQVGDEFKFLISLESPKDVTLENLRLQPSDTFGLQTVGKVSLIEGGKASSPSNVVRRLVVPARYDVPFIGTLSFSVEGMQTRVVRRRNFSSSSSTSFRSVSAPISVSVQPLPSAGQPKDFSGIVASEVTLVDTPDLAQVDSNDVITVSCLMRCDGYVPPTFVPAGVAFEWQRGQDAVEWKRYVVADGLTELPATAVSYYDPKSKTYKRAQAAPRRIRYR